MRKASIISRSKYVCVLNTCLQLCTNQDVTSREIFQCDHAGCNRTYERENLLRHHQRNDHTSRPLHLCDRCNSRYYIAWKMDQLINRQTGLKHVGGVCGLKFRSVESFVAYLPTIDKREHFKGIFVFFVIYYMFELTCLYLHLLYIICLYLSLLGTKFLAFVLRTTSCVSRQPNCWFQRTMHRTRYFQTTFV
jgi:hypothetical protein